MTTSIQGGCACGAIRFEAGAEPVMVAHCHCTDCQKITGAQMATVAGVPQDTFAVKQGEARVYDTVGDSGGKVHRSFCANCGSTLFSTVDVMPGVVFLEAGSLDDASGLVPTSHIYVRSAQPWAHLDDGIEKYDTLPPS